MTTLNLDLPDDLAAEMREAGLLSPDKLESVFRDALARSKKRNWFSEHLKRVGESDDQPMSWREIQDEIEAERRERRLAAGR